MPPERKNQPNYVEDEEELVVEDIGLPGIDVDVTIAEVLAVNVYSRLYDDFFLQLDMANNYQEAVANVIQIYPELDDEYEHLTQYSRAIEVIGRRYKKLKFESTKYATVDELGAMLSEVATGYAFSESQITWDGIAFVIMMVRQVIAETVANGLQGARDLFVMNWCIDYFSHPPHIHGDRSIDEWVDAKTDGWMTLLEPYNVYALIAPEPVDEPGHPSNVIPCRCERLQRRYENRQRVSAQCQFCSIYWCIKQECKFISEDPLSLVSHQRRCHKYPSTSMEIPLCLTCETQQPQCSDHRIYYQKCSANMAPVGCHRFWCLVDGCSANPHGLFNIMQHQSLEHPPKIYTCGGCDEGEKARDSYVKYNLCLCGTIWCLIGHCREEFDNMQALEDHQETCPYKLDTD